MATIRAVSLDMWFTAYLRTPVLVRRWEAARRRAVASLIGTEDGGRLPRETVLTADRRTREELARVGRNTDAVAPMEYLQRVAERAGGCVRSPVEISCDRYSLAGFDRNPPILNPELPRLRTRLEELGVPVILITNTHRLSESLRGFFAARHEPFFEAIVTSCEVGVRKPSPEIFRHAADRLGLAPAELLHAGDRLDSDVLGARAAGMRSVLYTGYWDRYPPRSEEARLRDRSPPDAAVPRVERLDELVRLI